MKNKTRYLKVIVVFCIAFIVAFTIASMILNYTIQIELNPTLTTCVYAFFGTELAATAIIRIMEDRNDNDDEETK
jgi:mannitol-specific phosphotransferase system IIBC component